MWLWAAFAVCLALWLPVALGVVDGGPVRFIGRSAPVNLTLGLLAAAGLYIVPFVTTLVVADRLLPPKRRGAPNLGRLVLYLTMAATVATVWFVAATIILLNVGNLLTDITGSW